MSYTNKLFDTLDKWRHFPNYQLERRADIFFSLYLSEVLKSKGTDVKSDFIPEFPVRIGTIYPDIETNKSYKIDYVGITNDGKKAILVELKTENLSRRDSQDKYLIASKSVGFRNLLEGVVSIFKATSAKRKYYHLLCALENLVQLSLPRELHEKIQSDSLRGVTALADEIQVATTVETCEVVYIQPTGEGEGVINFEDVQRVVSSYDDPISKRFAQSLCEWRSVKAGEGNCSS